LLDRGWTILDSNLKFWTKFNFKWVQCITEIDWQFFNDQTHLVTINMHQLKQEREKLIAFTSWFLNNWLSDAALLTGESYPEYWYHCNKIGASLNSQGIWKQRQILGNILRYAFFVIHAWNIQTRCHKRRYEQRRVVICQHKKHRSVDQQTNEFQLRQGNPNDFRH